jgi:hypothetical protein
MISSITEECWSTMSHLLDAIRVGYLMSYFGDRLCEITIQNSTDDWSETRRSFQAEMSSFNIPHAFEDRGVCDISQPQLKLLEI